MIQKKKVLLMCDLFPPAFGPRMGYLCYYLTEDFDVQVLTEWHDEQHFDSIDPPVTKQYIRINRSSNKYIAKIQWLWGLICGKQTQCFYEAASNLIESTDGTFDVIICSTFRSIPLRAASKVAKRFDIPLIVDLRDILEQYSGHEFISKKMTGIALIDSLIAKLFKTKSLYMRNKLLSKANYLTTVSPWHVDVLKQYNSQVALIYNGFDANQFKANPGKELSFTITYTGRLYSKEMRDPSLLFEAMSILDKEKVINNESFRVQWYFDESSESIIKDLAKQYNVESFMDYHRYIPIDKVPEVLNKSSILLVLTNKADAKGPKGIMTTKFFEALAMQKPILAVRGDEGCMEQVIHETKAGLSAHTVEEVETFLLHYYEQWKQTGMTSIDVDKVEVSKYSRENQSRKFISIINQVIS